MKRKIFLRSFFLIFAATGLFAATRTSFAQFNMLAPQANVTSAFLKADEAYPGGPCPITVNFSGYIKAAGPGTVKYTFTRSDGATGPVYALEFKEAGMQSVTTKWTLGDATTLPTYEGWQAIKILSPNELESSHETGSFSIKCSAVDQKIPAKPGQTLQGTPAMPNLPASTNVTEKPTGHEEKQSQAPRERLNIAAPAQFVPQDILGPVLKQRVTGTKPDTIRLIPDKNFAGIFIIKFVEGSHVRYSGDGFKTSDKEINKEEARRLSRLNLSIENVVGELVKINSLIRAYSTKYGFDVSSTFQSKRTRQDPEAQFKEKEMLETVAGEELADLDLYYTIAAKKFKDLPVQEAFMNELNKFASIELVEAAYLTEGASLKTNVPSAFEPQAATPDLSSNQTYLDAAPMGIDARYAWTVRGGLGDGVKVIDVEYDWVTDHEDFALASNRFWGDRPACAYDGIDRTTREGSGGSEHGTAVMGILNAPHNGFGMSGIVPNIRYGLSSACRPLDFLFASTSHEFVFTLFSGDSIAGRTHSIVTSYAINDAASALSRGDIVLIEQHTWGPSRNPCPWGNNCSQWEFVAMEYYQHSFDVIRRATARGIIVVEAAGNGGQNLDGTQYGRRFDPTFRHSGAIVVGASNGGGDLDRAGFSNYGSRIDVNGWGGGVATLGYGNGPMGVAPPWNVGVINRFYTVSFGGTSSASPMVAGAAASIQGARRANSREVLDPFQMRVLLQQTGTPQTVVGTPEDDELRAQAIGRQPNLRAAIYDTFGSGGRGEFTGAGTYVIQARHSGKILDVNIDWFSGQDNGRPVGQFDNNNGDHQKFIIERVGASYFTIRAKHSGKCLDVTGAITAPLTPLQQYQCNGGTNQQFAIEPVGDFYRIRARHSGLYFDIAGLSQNNGARLIQVNWTGGSNQLFRLIRTR